MDGKMFFGNEELMRWVTSPEIDADASSQGFSDGLQFEGGGASQVNSVATHMVYGFTWWPQSPDLIEAIESYALGSHGDGLIYFLDPSATRWNVLPQFWAAPRIGAVDGPILSGATTRPALATTATNTQQYPAKSAVYTLTGSEVPMTLRIPVPAGHTFHMGHHGAKTSTAAVTVQPDGGAVTSLTPLAANTATRTNYTYAASSDTFVTVSMDGAGTLTMSGLIAQVRPTGDTVPDGRFLSGKGHSGCHFVGHPRRRVNRAAEGLEKESLSAALVEVGAWLP